MAALAFAVALRCSAAFAAPPALVKAKPTTATEKCTDGACHGAIIEHKVMHGPAAQKKCTACHLSDEPRDHTFRFASAPDKMCADCHTLKHRSVVHQPVTQGRCTGCHNPHGSEYRSMLVDDPTRGLCLSCHKQAGFAQKKHVHGPVAAGACILCHEPHSSWQPKLLVEAPEKLCAQCHAEIAAKAGAERHVHAPVKDNCGSCHDAHASDHKFQLREAAPELCVGCHKDVQKALASAHTVHGAATQGDGCVSCHSPHFSQLPKLQKASQPDSCLRNCHDHAIKAADGRELVNMAVLLKENPQHHGPIRDGACTACHQPHAGDKFRLLTAEYPQQFYAPFAAEQYALCFGCHIPDLVLKKEGSGLTRFRSGDVNLHWLHVNREKGRTCRACHEVHASKRPFHIREAVPFGNKGWMLEINYRQTATGGSCEPGCHKLATYDHGGGTVPAPTPVPVPGQTEPAAAQQEAPLHERNSK